MTGRIGTFAILALLAAGVTAATAQPAESDPAATGPFDALLQAHVTGGGRVDYHAIHRDPAAANMLAAMRRSTVSASAPEGVRIAHGINAYNAAVIEAVLANWDTVRNAPNGVLAVAGFFDKTTHEIAGRKTTLNDFEGVYRALGKPEVHFGFNCGSLGCPVLPPRAYRGATVMKELDAAARAYLAQVTEATGSSVKTSELFFWYPGDWTKDSDPSRAAGRDETRRRLLGWLDPRHPAARYLNDTRTPTFVNRNDWDWAVNAVSRAGF